MRVAKIFEWHASHQLNLPYHSKCNNLHGHTYKILVEVEGPINKHGMVFDFTHLKLIINEISFDHKHLNKLLDTPTAENLVLYLYNRLRDRIPRDIKIRKIRVYETPTSYAEEVW